MVHSKNKGKSFELLVSHLIKLRGFYARRGQQFEGSSDSPDVVSELPFGIECKAVENLNVYKAYLQSVEDSHEDEIPMVVHKKNRKEILATMAFKEFLDIIKFIELKGDMDEFREYVKGVERERRRKEESKRYASGETKVNRGGSSDSNLL